MSELIMYIMAFGALLGGLDQILGNRFGLGKKFEDGFHLLGPTALSMVGIICLVPLLSQGIQLLLVPLYQRIGLDPGTLGGILAIDMGGYQLSKSLAGSQNIGLYSSIFVSATFGCTISFTIPVGMGMVKEKDKPVFAKGILIGLATMPVALLVGGLFSGLSFITLLIQSSPIFLFSILLGIGIIKYQELSIKLFTIFSRGIQIISTIGIALGAFQYMSGINLLLGLGSIEEAMKVVSSIGIVMLGSLPIAHILQLLLKKPLEWIGKQTKMNSASVTGILVSMVSAVALISMIQDMDERGKIINAAYLVSATALLAAHLGFTFGVEPSMVMPLCVAKFLGGFTSILAGYYLSRGESCE
ncbi:MAG: ethanolamine utilization protein EutH [Firmicutes bacterium]|nr:ethanolamine utilization protein EutH [Bacillota bacterium]